MSVASRRSRRVVAPVLLGLVLAGAVGPSLGHHHEGPAFGAGVHGGATFSPGAVHPNAPAHFEGTRSVDVRACAVCLLRAQTRGLGVPNGSVQAPAPDSSPGPAPSDPRIASLDATGLPGSRGPPPSRSLLT